MSVVFKTAGQSRAAMASSMSKSESLPATPAASATVSAVISDEYAMHWSSSDSASLIAPSEILAITAAASGERFTPSAFAMYSSLAAMSSGRILLKSNRWHLDMIVAGTLYISVVASMNFTCSGGSSIILRSALNA